MDYLINQLTPFGGIFLINKPTGWTSHDVVQKCRSIFKIKTIGHTGTLDPLATGLLIILIGKKYTQQQDHFLKQDKEYLVTACIGLTTDTYDYGSYSNGQITAQATSEQLALINLQRIKQKLKAFQGKIKQTVPAFSAVKIKGQALYKKARNQQVDLTSLPSREVTIKKILIKKLEKKTNGMFKLTLQVSCSSGTYIRSLVHDLGQSLGTGATVITLERTKIGNFKLNHALDLKTIISTINLTNHI